MAASKKKRSVAMEIEENIEIESDDGIDTDDEDDQTNEMVEVEFEARSPEDCDFHGIKRLLKQLFLKAHVETEQLTNLILSQNYVGSVIKQTEPSDEEDDDEDDVDLNEVFGITTVINLTNSQAKQCIRDLHTLLLTRCSNEGVTKFLRHSLQDEKNHLGLIINERFINIPSPIAVPTFEALNKEIKKANQRNMPFHFGYYVLIAKIHKLDVEKKSKKGKTQHVQEVIWANPEEEVIFTECDMHFEYSVASESDTGLTGKWTEDDIEMKPHRRVLIFSAEKLDSIVTKMQTMLEQ